jgi:nitrous oxide reductase accessory protein NosL
MKKLIISLLLLVVGLSATNIHKNYRTVPIKDATLLKTGKEKMYCSVCGMTLSIFYKTNHSADHDHIHDQYCSITCMIEDMIVNGKDLTNFKVVDNITLKFIPSQDAYFIVGSNKPGTMSMVSKYAFDSKNTALKFQKANGGKLMNFNNLVKLVKKAQAKDMKATKKRQAKAIKKGSKIYKKLCKPTNKKFTSTAQAKSFLKSSKICGKIKGKKLQAVGMF